MASNNPCLTQAMASALLACSEPADGTQETYDLIFRPSKVGGHWEATNGHVLFMVASMYALPEDRSPDARHFVATDPPHFLHRQAAFDALHAEYFHPSMLQPVQEAKHSWVQYLGLILPTKRPIEIKGSAPPFMVAGRYLKLLTDLGMMLYGHIVSWELWSTGELAPIVCTPLERNNVRCQLLIMPMRTFGADKIADWQGWLQVDNVPTFYKHKRE